MSGKMRIGTIFLAVVIVTLVRGDIAFQQDYRTGDFYRLYETRFDYDYYNEVDQVEPVDCLSRGDCEEAIDRQAESGSGVLTNILDPLDSVRTIFNVIDLAEIYTSLTSSSQILQSLITKYVDVSVHNFITLI
jgi:hypothetical protein